MLSLLRERKRERERKGERDDSCLQAPSMCGAGNGLTTADFRINPGKIKVIFSGVFLAEDPPLIIAGHPRTVDGRTPAPL